MLYVTDDGEAVFYPLKKTCIYLLNFPFFIFPLIFYRQVCYCIYYNIEVFIAPAISLPFW